MMLGILTVHGTFIVTWEEEGGGTAKVVMLKFGDVSFDFGFKW